jgi:RNA polymerase sigma-70 factor (ECF subfamily)
MARARIDAGSPLPDVQGLTDGELLVGHRRGDANAFAEFLARYRRRVYGYLVRCGVEDGARDDLFQEVFVRIHGAVTAYEPDRPVGPWVFAIVANVVRSHHRRARVREEALLAEPPPTDGAAPDCRDLVEARETAAWIEQALAALPLSQRQVVVLCCVEQLPQADVAAALGMPVNTVKTHLRRGRIALAQALARRRSALRREVSP